MTEPTFKITDDMEIRKALSWLSSRWERPLETEYFHARTLEEAVALLDRYSEQVKLISGGTDLIGLIKNKVLAPGVLVNLKTIPELRYIRESANGLEIGALTLIRDIEKSDLIRNKYPILREAASQIGSPQIRHMGTIGGNLCQQVRCWYYRRSPDTGISFDCRRKNEKGFCYAVEGENQNHAIFGGHDCWAVCPSDMATVLLALDARINTRGSAGERAIPVGEFYTALANALSPDEIITSIRVPAVSPEVRQRFIKFRVRKAIDFAMVSVAAVITLEAGTVSGTRVVLGGVSYQPLRVEAAEDILKGHPLTPGLATAAAEAAVAGARPLAKNSHKIPIAMALLRRAVEE